MNKRPNQVPDRSAGDESPGRDRRRISMRASLVIGFSSVLLLTATGIVFNGLYSARKVVRDLSNSILEQTRDLAELKIEAFFGTVSGINSATAVRLQNGLLVWQDWDSFRLFVMPMLNRIPQVAAVGAGDSEGNAYNLVRFGNNWRSQELRPVEWGTQSLWKEWTPQGVFVREWWEESNYDPRTRPWFTGAVTEATEVRAANPGEVNLIEPHWTPPYKFFTTGDYGLTVATQVPWTNRIDAVVYFDVRLADLDDFAYESKPSPNGFTLVLNEKLKVIGWPGRGEFARDKVLTGEGEVELATASLPHLSNALQSWRASGEPDELLDYVQHGHESIWLNFRSLPGLGTVFRVLIAVPEDDILGEARSERRRMAIVFSVALLVAIGLACWMAAVYTRPVSDLVKRSAAIQRLDLSEHREISSRIREVQQLSTAQASMASALESFSRYVPRDVIAELLRQGTAARIGAHPAELTVLFTDIRRFTAISETLRPDDVARYLSDYFEAVHQIIERHHGTTDKFIGDAIMAFWGAPQPDVKHASNAVRAVLACRDLVQELNRDWKAAGRPEFETTFGLATGPVVVGNVGAANRLNYTVLGNTVNVASRCVGLGRELGCSILALESVASATHAEIEWRRLGPVNIRGISHAMMVCEPLGLVGHVEATVLEFKRGYEKALDLYLARDFERALSTLASLAVSSTGAPSVKYLSKRCCEMQERSGSGVNTEMLSFG